MQKTHSVWKSSKMSYLNFCAITSELYLDYYVVTQVVSNIVKMRLFGNFSKTVKSFRSLSQLRDHFLGARKTALGSSFPCPGHTLLENAFQHAHSKTYEKILFFLSNWNFDHGEAVNFIALAIKMANLFKLWCLEKLEKCRNDVIIIALFTKEISKAD